MATKLSPAEINAIASKIQDKLLINKREKLAFLKKKIEASLNYKKIISLNKKVQELEKKKISIQELLKNEYPAVNSIYISGDITFTYNSQMISSIDAIKREIILKNISSVNPETLIDELVDELSKK